MQFRRAFGTSGTVRRVGHHIVSRRSFFVAAVAAFFLAAGLFGTARHALADASGPLQNVLSEIRFMGTIDFATLVDWAKHSGAKPDSTVFQPQRTEADILNLSPRDTDAVFAWLQGKGRGALYARGASDSQIGPARSLVDAPSTAQTPNPWRAIPLAAATLDQATQANVQILGGFAAVKKNGTSAIACVSFKNVDPRVAKRVLFEFPLLGGDGQVLGKLELDRSGEFSPNVDIRTFDSFEQWQSKGVGPVKSFNEGCIQRDLPTAAIPFLQARAAGYQVIQVDYADGSSSNSAKPGPAAPPAPAPAST